MLILPPGTMDLNSWTAAACARSTLCAQLYACLCNQKTTETWWKPCHKPCLELAGCALLHQRPFLERSMHTWIALYLTPCSRGGSTGAGAADLVLDAWCMGASRVADEAEGLRLVHGRPVLDAAAKGAEDRPGVLPEGLHHPAAVPASKALLKRLQAGLRVQGGSQALPI